MLSYLQPLRRLLPLIAFGALCARAQPPTEYEIKAVFLFHFTQFVEWPADAFSSPRAPFVIGIAGGDPFGPALQEIVRGETVRGHPVVVREVSDAADGRRCQILYVPEASQSRFPLRLLDGSPVLTVGESSDFFQQGGIVEFYTDRHHVRLRIDLAQARSRALVISAKLLRVAEVIDGSRLDRGGGFDRNRDVALAAERSRP